MSKKFYITEVFYSVQGEGTHVGAPSVFVRLFGCNLQCQGFGMPKGELSNEREDAYNMITTKDITTIEELPLVKTGCDSYVAWDKRFRHLSEKLTVEEIVERIVDITPNKSLNGIHVVFTGGEPMLNQRLINDVSSSLYHWHSLTDITIETNGTKLPDTNLWLGLSDKVDVTFSVSQKLACSGEKADARINLTALDVLFNQLRYKDAVDCVYKFVVADEVDAEEAFDIVDQVIDLDTSWIYGTRPTVFLMPVGGTKDDYIANSKGVADLALAYGVHYSPRLHIDIYGNAWGT